MHLDNVASGQQKNFLACDLQQCYWKKKKRPGFKTTESIIPAGTHEGHTICVSIPTKTPVDVRERPGCTTVCADLTVTYLLEGKDVHYWGPRRWDSIDFLDKVGNILAKMDSSRIASWNTRKSITLDNGACLSVHVFIGNAENRGSFGKTPDLLLMEDCAFDTPQKVNLYVAMVVGFKGKIRIMGYEIPSFIEESMPSLFES